MKVTLESTTKIVELNGVQARIWEGTTEGGIRVHAFITRIAAPWTRIRGNSKPSSRSSGRPARTSHHIRCGWSYEPRFLRRLRAGDRHDQQGPGTAR